MTSFIHLGVDYGDVICSPDAASALRRAKDCGVENLPVFVMYMEKYIQRKRPDWTFDRMIDYMGIESFLEALGASKEEIDTLFNRQVKT